MRDPSEHGRGESTPPAEAQRGYNDGQIVQMLESNVPVKIGQGQDMVEDANG
jgi:hypothetical protein